MKLVKDWAASWRWHSMQIYAVIATLPIIWLELPEETKALIPDNWQTYIVSALAVIGAIGRLRDQTK